MEIELNWDNKWVLLLIVLMFYGWDIPGFNIEELKRYAELVGIDLEKLQELEDKKLQG